MFGSVIETSEGVCVPDSLVLKDRHPSDRALLASLLFHKPLHSPDTLHFEVDVSSKLYPFIVFRIQGSLVLACQFGRKC